MNEVSPEPGPASFADFDRRHGGLRVGPLGELAHQLRQAAGFLETAAAPAPADAVEVVAAEVVAAARRVIVELVRLLSEAVAQDHLAEPVTRLGDSPSPRPVGLSHAVDPDGPDGWTAVVYDAPAAPVTVRHDTDELSPRVDAPVDCAARMHVCHAVCCRLPFPLSTEELEAGVVRWDLGRPYFVRRGASGFCVHNDRSCGECAVYDDRPVPCRTYSCRNDRRIWKDFDGLVLNDLVIDAFYAQPGEVIVSIGPGPPDAPTDHPLT